MYKRTQLARALALAFGGTLLALSVQLPTQAQSNTTGLIYGQVPQAGDAAVLIENQATGVKRRVNPGADGKFQATALPPGSYKVSLLRGDAVQRSMVVEVQIGQGAQADLLEALQSVQVTGRRKTIDVSNTNNGAAFTALTLAALPTAQNVDAIIQLAPNTTRADSRYAGASFGGGAASENSYYINGFPVTNSLTGLGSSELPFGAVAQAQILTGGFGAEFGRSIGGVVNIITKSGSNQWEAGASLSLTPQGLRSKYRDILYPTTGAAENAATDGKLYRRREDNRRDDLTLGAYVGGPLIKDRLFMFVAVEKQSSDTEGVNRTKADTVGDTAKFGWYDREDRSKRYLAKFDWALHADHNLELTLIGDDSTRVQRLSGYDYDTRARNGKVLDTGHFGNNPITSQLMPVGGDVQIAKYTGNFGDELTVTSLYGQKLTKKTNTWDEYDVYAKGQGLYSVVAPQNTRAPGKAYDNFQPSIDNILPKDAQDRVKAFRLDVEYRMGRHTLRAGLDEVRLNSRFAGEAYAGGGVWRYFKTDTPQTPITMSAGPLVAVGAGAAPGSLAAQGYYVRERIFHDETDAQSNQSAQYLEDRYQVNRDLLLIAGLRNEQFVNKNGDGQTFIKMGNQLLPRFAAAWDANGDASLKVFGSAGRYAIQLPTAAAVRGASRSTLTEQFYTYTGVDAQGQPTGRQELTGVRSVNNEVGQAKDARSVAATDLKPAYQDELTLGFEKALNPSFNFGGKLTYRVMKTAIDDFCDARPMERWLKRHPEIDASKYAPPSCLLFNPGRANTFLADFSNTKANYTSVTLSNEDLGGYESARRTYVAIDLFAEHPLRDGWYGRVNYTWSRNKGNTEGQTRSETGQTDIGQTQSWDTPELMVGANGLLPNHRAHQIKAFGFVDLTPQWSLGANLLLASGRPKNCVGNQPASFDPNYNYGSAYFFCDGKPAPRGSAGNLPWDQRLDLNVVYKPQQLKGLALKVDMFNVFNRQITQNVDETYNSGSQVSATYGRVVSYTDPRSVKLTVSYEHSF
nr:TonB-dependent receptor [uncultured Roseateles sp.]